MMRVSSQVAILKALGTGRGMIINLHKTQPYRLIYMLEDLFTNLYNIHMDETDVN